VADLPPLGYRVYHLDRTEGDPQPATQDGPRVDVLPGTVVNDYDVETDGRSDLALENGYYRLEIDGRLGDIRRLRDIRVGLEVFNGHAAVGLVIDDPSDTWSHGVTAFRAECGRFADAEVRLVESGPVRAVVRSRTRYGHSTLVQDFVFYRELPWIEVRVGVDWHERLKMLKLAFPVDVSEAEATFEIPYGAIVRPTDGREVPGQGWFDLTGRAGGAKYGLSILNDGKYSFDIMGAEMRMTVLRSPVYAHHTPRQLEAGQDYHTMDQGRHEFRYVLLPHAGPWQAAGSARLAQVLNRPVLPLTEGIHPGRLLARDAYLWTSSEHVLVTVLKVAEEGDDVIVRCVETGGAARRTTIALPFLGREIAAEVGPWQIKTWRLPRDPNQTVRETNFLED
jgi:alpha-mannosidase